MSSPATVALVYGGGLGREVKKKRASSTFLCTGLICTSANARGTGFFIRQFLYYSILHRKAEKPRKLTWISGFVFLLLI